ncbi:heavy-metal-associated domain-containing protein [Candidatus Pacearchaeota archaeon]|nr:heavy-metal-associated domain-containing protein [Candidatus Pacearchaeota archaeon]
MEKEINFIIKKGVYCSWCANLMKAALRQHFSVKEVEVDILNGKIHLTTYKRVNPISIIAFLKKRGYILSQP